MMRFRFGKFGGWVYIGLMTLLLSACATTVAVQQLEQFDAKALERDVIMRTGQQLDGTPSPSPIYGPGEVVRLQMEALRTNNGSDDGIEIVFRFASPRNKQMTGPLRHFAQIIKSPSYRPMLGHRSAIYGDLVLKDSDALQRVRIIDRRGREIVYLFLLSRQSEETCGGCWMTDIVVIESITPVQSI